MPWGPAVAYADQKKDDALELLVYPGKDAAFTLYEDEGDSYRYENGAFSTIHLLWNEKSQQLIIGGRDGQFPGMLHVRKFRITRMDREKGIDSLPFQGKNVSYNGKKLTVAL